jgi:hypothetical protein
MASKRDVKAKRLSKERRRAVLTQNLIQAYQVLGPAGIYFEEKHLLPEMTEKEIADMAFQARLWLNSILKELRPEIL